MKVICTQENLKAGLVLVGRVVPSSNTLPILSNLLIKTQNGGLEIQATNLEVAITTQTRCKIEEEGGVTVVGKTITDLINNTPNKNITLLTNKEELSVDTDNYHTKIKTLPPEDFPLVPQVDGGNMVEFDAQELKQSLDQVVFAASTNQTQPEISGILFLSGEGFVKIVATDRYRLAEKKLKPKTVLEKTLNVIVPQKTALELSRIIGGQKGDVVMVFNQNQTSFTFQETKIVSRLVDGQYPDYKEIIPGKFSTTAVVQKQELTSALRAASVFCQSGNSVKFGFLPDKQGVVLDVESADLGKSVIQLPAKIEGEGGEILFNYRYVLDCLANLETDNVIFKINNDDSPGLLLPDGKEDYIYLVMPIKS
jgi:DNA polymerase III subunit beta